MNGYETSIPRVSLGIAAVAMTAITIGVSVVMPANMDFDSREPRMLAASKASTLVSAGVAVHGPGLATVACTSSQSNRKLED